MKNTNRSTLLINFSRKLFKKSTILKLRWKNITLLKYSIFSTLIFLFTSLLLTKKLKLIKKISFFRILCNISKTKKIESKKPFLISFALIKKLIIKIIKTLSIILIIVITLKNETRKIISAVVIKKMRNLLINLKKKTISFNVSIATLIIN